MRMDVFIRPLIQSLTVAACLATPWAARAADCTPRDTISVTPATTGDASKKIHRLRPVPRVSANLTLDISS